MLQSFIQLFHDIPREALVVLLGALPVSELRGALPLALSFGMSPLKAVSLAVLGNLLPVIPLLLFLEPVSTRLRRFKIWARFFDWLFERTKRKADTIQKYEAIGLALFVAIPLPMTGAWTGAIAASLFKMRFRYAITAIIAGVLVASLIVLALCMLGMMSWKAISG